MGHTKSSGGVVVVCMLVAVLAFELREVRARTTQEDMTLSPYQGSVRNLVERENNYAASDLSARTERVDPLDHFRKYSGGYNITNKHYWSSTIFTGVYGYSIAALWLFGGVIYAGFLLITTICFVNKGRRREIKRFSCSKRYCFWPVLLGIFFTLLAIIASGVVLGGSSKFHSAANSIKNIIGETADNATGAISNVTGAVRAIQNNKQLNGYLEGSSRLNSTSQRLDDEAAKIERKAEKNMRLINKALKILKVTTIATVTLNLIAVLALLASGPLRFRRTLHLLIILCWLLTFLFWIYFGLYFFLDKFAGDTCTALDEYRQDPQNSSLSLILPCNDQLSAKSVLHDTREGIHDIIDQVNANISSLQSMSLPGLEYVCNPFSEPPEYNYQTENCSSNTIQIGDIPRILKRYACSDSTGGTCEEGEFISASDYSKVLVYTSSIQDLLNAFPGIESLVNCQLVRDAFSEILFKQCKPAKKYVHMTWAALAVLSTIMVVIVLIWTIEAHHDGRNHHSGGSVKPHSTSADTPEVDTTGFQTAGA